MKFVRKWLFPVLTCLIAAGAAVLPPAISQIRDEGQFGQIHTQEMSVDALGTPSPAQTPTLLDRMELFANQYSTSHPILSSSTSMYAEDLDKQEQALALRDLLVEGDIVPDYFLDETLGASDEAFQHCAVQRLLLWDPAGEWAVQEPSQFYLFAWHNSTKLHSKSLSIAVDGETGLPIQLCLSDTNIAQWQPYTMQALADAAGRYFELMGWTMYVDVFPMDPIEPESGVYHQLYFSLPDTGLYYQIIQAPTALNILLCSGREGANSWFFAGSGGFDG